MKTSTEEIQTVLTQIKEYGSQISKLTALQEAATARISWYLEELDFSSNGLVPVEQKLEAELRNSPLYIWENIGEGG